MPRKSTQGMDSFVVAALVICSLAAPVFGDKGISKARSCSDIRLFYSGKGFALDGVPQSELSGEHLRICAQGYTCCTSDMEDNLATLSRRELEGLLKDDGRSLQTSLTTQYKAFDGYFVELLNRSAISLHESFTSTWGIVYSQNSHVFSGLYTDLRHYYRGSSVNLEEVLNEFWARLLEKLFAQSNKPSFIGEDYLECVSKQIDTLRPFGEIPRQVKTMVTHTFVAARSFVQGLVVSGEVVRKVSQAQLSRECMRAVMRMTYCPHCRGMPSARPCANFCTNVMKGCLANHADLDTEWRYLAEAMMQVADSFDGPSGVDNVILNLPNQISEAMMNMIENTESINSKLFQACGKLGDGGGSSRAEKIFKEMKVVVDDKMESSSSKMDQLVADVTIKLRHMQPYWVSLPNVLCSDRVATGTGAEDKCWNGMTRARYLPEVIGDGLTSQINNPEVEIDITRPDMTIRQQIMQLRIMTLRLKKALNGQDIDFLDTSDDVSGSGSGMCADEMCHRGPRLIDSKTDRPVFYADPPKNNEVKGAAAQNLPGLATQLLLLLLLLLLRR